MKKMSLMICVVLISACCFGQNISLADKKTLQLKEDSLKIYSFQIFEGTAGQRLNADSIFTKIFVRALKTHNSFLYPFDSLKTISELYSPDSSFRVFTWQLELSNNIVFQHGAIQIRTEDGSLKLYPLIDKSNVINNIDDTVTDNKNWVGAVYYRIILTKNKDKNYYTLLGYDEDYELCNRKIIEVLTFNENKQPVFGGDYFLFGKTLVKRTPHARYIMEYKKDAAAKLNYDPELGMIIMEHLISENGHPENKSTLIGDGDYEGFRWINGQWVHVDKVFTQITPEGQTPTPNPILDPAGNFDQSKMKNNLPEEKTEPKKKVN